MLPEEAGQSYTDWYLIAKEGALTVKLSAGTCIGEDAAGTLLLAPTPEQAQVLFNIDDEGRLVIRPASQLFALLSPEREDCDSYVVQPLQGIAVWLCNNQLTIANDLQGSGVSSNQLPITVIRAPAEEQPHAAEEDDVDAEAILVPEAGADAAQLADIVESPEYEASPPIDPGVPLLSTPVRSPTDTGETLITQLPYGFERDNFADPQPRPTLPAAQSRRPFAKSIQVAYTATAILVVVMLGLLAGNLGIIAGPDPEVAPLADAAPALPQLVLLSGRQATPADRPTNRESANGGQGTLTMADATPTTPQSPAMLEEAELADAAAALRNQIAVAARLLDQGFITAPRSRNSVATLQRVLAEHPDHPEATALLMRCADRLVAAAMQANRYGMQEEARRMVAKVMAFYPDHRQALALNRQWEIARDA